MTIYYLLKINLYIQFLENKLLVETINILFIVQQNMSESIQDKNKMF